MPFDLLEFDGADLRSSPIEERKQHLAWALRERHHGIALNATYKATGALIYQYACAPKRWRWRIANEVEAS
jgi:ATP-dependent DNA ligase